MKILISNDDGVYADGIQALAKAMRSIGDVTVVAPDRNRSGASNSLSLSRPVRLKEIAPQEISVEGTPTDCVHIAVTGLLEEQPDMVLSGINAGSNLGDDVWYSGTVAAAMEGRFLGFPAVAFSLVGEALKHYETGAKVAELLVKQLIHDPLPPATILNVNIPDVPFSEVKGFEVTRLGTRHCAEPTIKQTDPRGAPIYWIGPAGKEEDAGEGTDFYAVKNNRVSITPLRVDLTHYQAFDQLASWVSGIHIEYEMD